MTIGIAAICDSGRTVVLAADRQFSAGFTSGESKAGKMNNFGRDWYVAFSAKNTPNAFEAIMEGRLIVAGLDDRVWHDVMPAIERGYQKVRNSKTEALYLASLGETSEAFHASGKDRIPETVYAAVQHTMRNYDLEADLLVVGFDDTSHIYTVRNPGISQDHTALGFWAIGSGAPAALASLFARKCSFHCHVEEVLYLVYEAKIQAEKASNVGAETDLYILCKGNVPLRITEKDQFDVLDPIWRDLSPRDIQKEHLLKVGSLSQIGSLKNLHEINWQAELRSRMRLSLLPLRRHNLREGMIECFRAFLIVHAEIASGLLKPLVLIFLTWLCRFWRGGFCHMASQ